MLLSDGASVSLVPFVPLAALAGVNGKTALMGVFFCEMESLGARVPYLSEGNVADMGDSAFGLRPIFAGES